MTAVEWAGWWLTLVGTLVSIAGLLVTYLAYAKIKQVRAIMRQKALNVAIISNIEGVMRYQENIQLSPDLKRNIENILSSIETILSPSKRKHKYEKTQILAIKTELRDSVPNIKNIKSIFKNLKAIVVTLEDE